MLPGRCGIASSDPAREPAVKIDHWENPDETRHDDDHADDRGGNHEVEQRVLTDTGDQRAGLQSGGQKDHAFDEVDQKIPEENALEPRGGANQVETVPADVETGGNGREDARAAEMLGRPIGK